MNSILSPESCGINSDLEKLSGVEKNSSGQNNANDSLIKIDHLVKTYKMGDVEVHALRGVSFNVSRGEFVAIMGASGSGKSTFMNILGCLDKPTKGTYLLDNINVGNLSRDELALIRNKKLGFVFQGFNLLSRTTALENVELPLFYNSTSTKLRKEKSIEALKKVGLAERIYHYPNQLSGGQQQRVAIARALVNDPSIVLADEPTGNLDSRTSIEVMEIFQKLNEQGITIILVTHEPDIALFTKRHIVFRDGKIKSDKSNSEPKNATEELKTIPSVDDEVEE
ncbi:MAG: ABC transporter ATP-binding protein [Ignavibacteriaceae bacterium]|nr:ABC transporter ATP-binding protein [Ignavibacteriaceae bacterium]